MQSSMRRLLFSMLLLLLFLFSAYETASAQLIIGEFRVRGPNGANDEFIELYNNSGADHTVAGGGTGYAVAASNGVARCVVPNGTVIPNRGHYLCVNSVGYSLASYPAGNGTTATGDATYTTDIPDNAGIAIFNTSVAGNFVLANRLDAVGSTSEANTLYKEGTGYPALTPFSINYSFYRKIVGTCTNAPNNCGLVGGSFLVEGMIPATVQDTNNNAVDFVFVDTNGTSAGAGQRLGAPGPENLSGPIITQNTNITPVLLDATLGSSAPPNRQRDGGAFCAPPNPVVPPCVPAQNSTFGTISFRRRFINNTGQEVTRLRLRVIDQTTFPAVSGVADLRNRTSSAVVIATINDPATCAAKVPPEAAPCSVTVQGTTLEEPPTQPNGSAYNSSMSAGTVTLATPLDPGESINLQLLFGIQQMGNFRAFLMVEALTNNVVQAASGNGQPSGGGEDGTTDLRKKLKKYAPTPLDYPMSPSNPASPAPTLTPANPGTTRRNFASPWFINIHPLTGNPTQAGTDDDPEDEAGDSKEEKKSKDDPTPSEQPAPPPSSAATPAAPAATTAPAATATPLTPASPASIISPVTTRPKAEKKTLTSPKNSQRRNRRRAG
ncbi:MAG: hypothetical protein H7Z38_17800 [Rubrivivax sp.]|nr:hypothetical protein [Pyrinomonadaceae bacterium]